jgi:UDP-N-acetyl-D-glucosamine dehydrogenase
VIQNELESKITRKKAVVGVIGIGYVGLPLAVEFAHAGFRVWGIDLDERRVKQINAGRSYIEDIPSGVLKPLVETSRFTATSNPGVLASCDCIIICVPTPLNKVKEPDISYVLSAARMVKKSLKRGQLIILESTTYPGTTEETVLPELTKKGFKPGRDFFLCFSPERIDPGNKNYPLKKIPKVVGGLNRASSRLGKLFYGQIIGEVMEVSSPRVAEMAKLLENTFRIVNIGLMNELAVVSRKLGINIWEAIDAAKTKPFGYMPFYPGPGVGGHCIGIDPLYLSWKAKLEGVEIRFVELASRVNSDMPGYVVTRAAYALNERGKTLSRSEILMLGVAYKRNVSDVRESPALNIIEELKKLGAVVRYHDPHVPYLNVDSISMKGVPLTEKVLKAHDLVIIVTDHAAIDYEKVARHARLVLDTRNVLKKMKSPARNVILL